MGWLRDGEKMDTDNMADLAGGAAQNVMPCSPQLSGELQMMPCHLFKARQFERAVS